MIIDSITLYNFGLYKGTQTIKLKPPAPDKPIILIGGLNGGGKTTFLDALQLVLFGPHAKCSNRGTLAYPEYLSRCIHKQSGETESGIEIYFRHTAEGVEEFYHLRRFWKLSGSGCREQFEVFKNGQPKPVLADNWATQVEEFFPANIAHLFLFDGEQVEAYASQHDSSKLIGTAIQNLLGLDMVDQLEKDLLVYERRKRSEDKNAPRHTETTSAQDAVRNQRGRVDALKQERAALQTHGIDKQRRKLKKAEEKYRKSGGVLYDQREAVESKWSNAVRQVQDGEAALREYAGGAAPLHMVQALLESASLRDQQEEQCRRARELAGVLEARDKVVLKHLRNHSSEKKVIAALKAYLDSDRAERNALGRKDTFLDITPEVRSDLHTLLRGKLNQLGICAAKLLAQQSNRRADEENTRVEYDSIPSSDTIGQITKERQNLLADIEKLEVAHAALGQDIERQQRNLEHREQTLINLLEADVKDRELQDDRYRILRHAGKVRKTLKIFRQHVIARHVLRIEQLVFESFRQLLRKNSLVTRLSINPSDYSLTLYDSHDTPLSAERLSAGERQLLAIALLWGLAKASGRPLPTAIDTPLGRLDSIHRMHLVERYLPFASHQILLLSTDEEIAGEYHKRLYPWIGHTYQLAYDDTTHSTRVTTGYIPSREAA